RRTAPSSFPLEGERYPAHLAFPHIEPVLYLLNVFLQIEGNLPLSRPTLRTGNQHLRPMHLAVSDRIRPMHFWALLPTLPLLPSTNWTYSLHIVPASLLVAFPAPVSPLVG